MKTKVRERKGSARPPAHDHNGTHTKRVLPEARSFHQLDRDCSAGQNSPRLSDVSWAADRHARGRSAGSAPAGRPVEAETPSGRAEHTHITQPQTTAKLRDPQCSVGAKQTPGCPCASGNLGLSQGHLSWE